MTTIMFIIFLQANSSRPFVVTQEFNSDKACRAAAVEVAAGWKDQPGLRRIVCMPKGGAL